MNYPIYLCEIIFNFKTPLQKCWGFFVNYFFVSLQYGTIYKGRTLWQGTRTAIRKRTIKKSINFKPKEQ